MTGYRRFSKGNSELPILLLLGAAIFGSILVSEAQGCQVHDVEFYVAESNSEANSTTARKLVLCDPCDAFWLRVEWWAGEYGDEDDEDFDIRIIEMIDTQGNYDIIHEVDNVPDDDNITPQVLVFDVNPDDPDRHKLYAEVRRDGTDHWERSNHSCYVYDGDDSLQGGITYDFDPAPHDGECPWSLLGIPMCSGTEDINDWCGNNLRLRCANFSGCSGGSMCSWQYEYQASGSSTWTNVGVCVWPGNTINYFEYKSTPQIPGEKWLFLRTFHLSGNPTVGSSTGYGCEDRYCWVEDKYYCVDANEDRHWYRDTEMVYENGPPGSGFDDCPGPPGTHYCYGENP